MLEKSQTLDRICFVISPIGREGTEVHQKFREVLDFVIKPAVEQSHSNLYVLRADDIERSGSFIKDILEYVANAFVVIADLTNQNPNVFYELGVRHSLCPRTILIAQALEDIPSDLREYRTIIYDMSAKGAILFKQRLEKYLTEIFGDPQRPDNPVLDRLGSVIDNRTRELEAEVNQLRMQLENVLRKGVNENKTPIGEVEYIKKRVGRILNLMEAYQRLAGYRVEQRAEEGYKLVYDFPGIEGDFYLYSSGGLESKEDMLYVAMLEGQINFEKELADIRVLMKECSVGRNLDFKFVIATNENLDQRKQAVLEAFDKVKGFVSPEYQDHFELEIWDQEVLLQKEKELGIKVEWQV